MNKETLNSKISAPQTKDQAWLHALRLRTLPLSISGILVGGGLTYLLLKEENQVESKGFWLILSLALLTTVAFQIVSNLANDLGDSEKGTDNAQRIGPTRAVQSGLISQSQMRGAMIFSAVVSLLLAAGIIVSSAPNLSSDSIVGYAVLAVACVAAAITYTVGKNAYGYRGLGDVMVFLFFGCVSVMGTFSLFGFGLQFIPLLGAIAVGAWSTGVLNLNNLRDHENDSVSGKRTLVVKMGFEKAKGYHTFLMLFGVISWNSLVTILVFYTGDILFLLSVIPIFVLLTHTLRVRKETNPRNLDKELKVVALSTFAASLILFLGCLV
jgi:1,4-dihydroxy-2-naphthoate polyprenyltransferase